MPEPQQFPPRYCHIGLEAFAGSHCAKRRRRGQSAGLHRAGIVDAAHDTALAIGTAPRKNERSSIRKEFGQDRRPSPASRRMSRWIVEAVQDLCLRLTDRTIVDREGPRSAKAILGLVVNAGRIERRSDQQVCQVRSVFRRERQSGGTAEVAQQIDWFLAHIPRRELPAIGALKRARFRENRAISFIACVTRNRRRRNDIEDAEAGWGQIGFLRLNGACGRAAAKKDHGEAHRRDPVARSYRHDAIGRMQPACEPRALLSGERSKGRYARNMTR